MLKVLGSARTGPLSSLRETVMWVGLTARRSMPKMPHPGEHHRKASLIRRCNYLIIAH